MRSCAIYSITNMVNGKCYVGSSVSMTQRINRHFNHLRNGIHYNQKLQRAFDKYGEWAFEVRQIDECFVSERASCESAWIERLNSTVRGYNICPLGMSVRGAAQSEEHVARRVASKKGYKHSDETRAKLSAKAKARGKGAHLSTPEMYAKIALARTGSKHSDETKAKLSLIAKNRPPMSAEARAKISARMKALRATRYWSNRK